LSTSQLDLSMGIWTTVLLDTESFDVGSNFNTGTYTFTVPVTGYYQVNYGVSFTNEVAGILYYTRIYKNSNTAMLSMNTGSSDTNPNLALSSSGVLYLTSTDTLILQARVDTSSTVDLSSGFPATQMSIHLLSI